MTSDRQQSTEPRIDEDMEDGFDSTSSAYELEPFLLPGERITQNKIPAIEPGQTLQELDAYDPNDISRNLDPVVIGPEQIDVGTFETERETFEPEDPEPTGDLLEPVTPEASSAQPAGATLELDRLDLEWQTLPADQVEESLESGPVSTVAEPPALERPDSIASGEYQMLKEYEKRNRVLREQARLDPLIGNSIAGSYGIFELIGRGNMASIYKARQYSTGAIVACKTFRDDADEHVIARFEREIATHSLLSHKNIVSFIDTVQDDKGRLFLIMELLKGISLQEVIELHGPIERPENIWTILHQVCNALEYAHDMGVIHRDLKTANIILSKEEDEEIRVKVLDFGISKLERLEKEKLTWDGRAVGSPHYMSPEQCQGGELIPSSDLYSLGVAVYEMITGRPPYYGLSILEVLEAHCNPNLSPQPLSAIDPNIPGIRQLETIVFKILETDPEERISSAAQLRKCIDFWISLVRAGELEEPIPEELMVSEPTVFKPAREQDSPTYDRLRTRRAMRHALRVSVEALPAVEGSAKFESNDQSLVSESESEVGDYPEEEVEQTTESKVTEPPITRVVILAVIATFVATSLLFCMVYILVLK